MVTLCHATPSLTVESSLRLTANALRMVGVPVDNIDRLFSGVRRTDYELVSPRP